jgi:lysophospholipase L1-like esterase
MKTLVLAVTVFALSVSAAFSQAQPANSQTPPQSVDPELEHLIPQLQRAHIALNDWPNLGRYRDADASTPPPAPSENRVVFMGDSITDGWGKGKAQFFPGKPYINRGISGQTTPQMLVRFRPDVIHLQPKVVVTLAGTNDLAGNTGVETLQNIEDNLSSMSELAKANGIRVVLASVMPICDSLRPQSARRPPQQIVTLNEWIKSYTAKNGFVYLDYYSAMVDGSGMLKQELTYDCLHPNDAGYEVMAPLAEKAISEALKK